MSRIWFAGFTGLVLFAATLGGCPAPADSDNSGNPGQDSSGGGTNDGTTGGGSAEPVGGLEPAPDRDGDDGGSGGSSDGDDVSDGGGSNGADASDGSDGGDGSSDDGSSGDDANGGGDSSSGGDASGVAITGQFLGQLDCYDVQSVDDNVADPQHSVRSFSIQFDDAGVPSALFIVPYITKTNLVTDAVLAGASDVLDIPTSGGSIQYGVTVREATYTETTAQVVLDLTYDETNGALVQSGTGVQTVDLSVAGDVLTVNVVVEYSIDVTAPVTLDLAQTVTCTGTLPRQ